MFTLSDASFETKEFIKWGVVFIIAIILIFMAIKIAFIVKDALFPPPPTKPTMAFGKLPQQSFPASVSDRKFVYSINTVSGGLPSFPQQIKVYRIEPNIPDLLAVKKMDAKAQSIDFDQGYTALTDKILQWSNNGKFGEIPKTLNANILTGNFTISSGYLTNPDVVSGKKLRNNEEAISKAKDMLTSMGLLSDDLDLENIKINLFSISNNALRPASSISQSQIIEVNFLQKDVDKLHIVYDKPNSSNIGIFVAGDIRMQIVAAKYTHHSISDKSATYLLKSSKQAYNELKQGNGYIASYSGDTDNISINDVALAYYMSNQTQDFLMPVYVFTGNDNFYAYLPAITDESISK